MSIPSLPLNDGRSIPQLGLGTYGLWNAEGSAAIADAIELGYRHLDTAVRYDNEEAVGAGIRSSGVDRADLFVTTKLDGEFQGDDRAVAGLHGSLERLGLDYVDLLLIHWPLPKRGEYVSTWQTFERLQAEGLVRSIGVSNFKPAHLDVLAASSSVVPAVNQIELSPLIQRHEYRAYDEAHGIVTESWSPIKGILDSAVLAGIGERYGKSAVQVALRWHVQNGLVVIPKSGSRDRLAENLAIVDFELSPEDLGAIAALDGGPDAGADSDRIGH